MSITLALVTCGPQLEVALSTGGTGAPSTIRLAGGSPRSKLLLAAVELLVEDAGLDPSAIERVVVTRGPGSFTGIRSGLASAAGLEAAIGAKCVAYDSLTAQAARCLSGGTVWTAQPGRRGEVYAQQFHVATDAPPVALTTIQIVAVADAGARGPWVGAEALDLAVAERVTALRTAAEGLLALDRLGAAPQPMEPLYVEGPPIHQVGRDG
jgi:tRNA threonylcarbamoyl adenosine modification protein YeaZ